VRANGRANTSRWGGEEIKGKIDFFFFLSIFSSPPPLPPREGNFRCNFKTTTTTNIQYKKTIISFLQFADKEEQGGNKGTKNAAADEKSFFFLLLVPLLSYLHSSLSVVVHSSGAVDVTVTLPPSRMLLLVD